MAYDKFGDADCSEPCFLILKKNFFLHSQTKIILGKEGVLFNLLLLTVSSDLQQPVAGN